MGAWLLLKCVRIWKTGRRVGRTPVGLVLQHEVRDRLDLGLRLLELVVGGHALAGLRARDVHLVRAVAYIRDRARDRIARGHGVDLGAGVPRAVGPVEARVEDGVLGALVAPREDGLDERAVPLRRLDAEPAIMKWQSNMARE